MGIFAKHASNQSQLLNEQVYYEIHIELSNSKILYHALLRLILVSNKAKMSESNLKLMSIFVYLTRPAFGSR